MKPDVKQETELVPPPSISEQGHEAAALQGQRGAGLSQKSLS
jgi:hypothetical protein